MLTSAPSAMRHHICKTRQIANPRENNQADEVDDEEIYPPRGGGGIDSTAGFTADFHKYNLKCKDFILKSRNSYNFLNILARSCSCRAANAALGGEGSSSFTL